MTEQLRRVSRALISVSDKTGVVDFARVQMCIRDRSGAEGLCDCGSVGIAPDLA